jgi:hypothetical protein
MNFRIVFAAVAIAALAGCGSTQVRGGGVAGASIPAAGKVCYLPLADGHERGGDVVAGSGATMTAALRDELVSKGFDLAPLEPGGIASGLAEAQTLACDYLLHGEVTEWEDNATEWSGKGDSIGLSAELFRVGDGKVVSSASVRKKASAMAFVSRSPERFGEFVAASVVAQLFGLPQPKE